MILLRPVDVRFQITQRWGENVALYPYTNGHNGIDYGLPIGSQVRAAHDGRVVVASLDPETERNPGAGYGRQVRIEGPGYLTIYGHLDSFAVQAGDYVAQGQAIGGSGNTGRSTGPHLHFELRTGAKLINAIDPAPYIVDVIPTVLMIGTITPAGDDLNVRTAPSTNNTPLRTLDAGSRVEIVGIVSEAKIWYRLSDGTYIRGDAPWIDLQAAEA